jgi:hypothetical protein
MSYNRVLGSSWRGNVAEPVCIAQSAISPGVPVRDLYVSQGHALLLAGTLILAKDLVNGLTITLSAPEELSQLDYFHLEFGQHEVVYAEGAAVESLKVLRGRGYREAFSNFAEFERLYGRDDTNMTAYARRAADVSGSIQVQLDRLAARARLLRAGTAAALDHKAAA